MSEILTHIRKDVMDVRRKTSQLTGITTHFLGYLISEVEKFGKNNGNRATTDEEALKIIKNLSGSMDQFRTGSETEQSEIDYMNGLVQLYQKSQLTEEEIRTIVTARKDAGDNIGAIMKYFKENYTGQYDGKVVSTITKE